MDIVTVAQLASSATNMISVIIIALGYYYSVRLSRQSLEEMKANRLTGGRAMVIVCIDQDSLPNVDIVIRNAIGGAALGISFEVSAPIEDSRGEVISDLPIFTDGLDFLSPGSEITIHWDRIDALLPYLKRKGIDKGVSVTVRYHGMVGIRYENTWRVNPFIYGHDRQITRSRMVDLIDAVDDVAESISGDGSKRGISRQSRGSTPEKTDHDGNSGRHEQRAHSATASE